MKYINEVIIDLPRANVIELFDNPENMTRWMDGLVKFEHLEGTPGQPGAKSKLHFKQGKREFEMIETVVNNDLPHSMTGTYEIKGAMNFITNRFEEVASYKTKWSADNEFKFSGFFMKIMAFFMPGAFKKQGMKYMLAFKEFAENQV